MPPAMYLTEGSLLTLLIAVDSPNFHADLIPLPSYARECTAGPSAGLSPKSTVYSASTALTMKRWSNISLKN